MKKLNDALVTELMEYLDKADPYILRLITNRFDIDVRNTSKYEYHVFMVEIEKWCKLDIGNTINVLTAMRDDSFNNTVY